MTASFLVKKLSATFSPDAASRVVHKMRLLSKSGSDQRAFMGEAGAVPMLVPLLYSEDVGLQLNAVTALLNLSILEANKKRIMHADGAVEAVAHTMGPGGATWRAKENAPARQLEATYGLDSAPARRLEGSGRGSSSECLGAHPGGGAGSRRGCRWATGGGCRASRRRQTWWWPRTGARTSRQWSPLLGAAASPAVACSTRPPPPLQCVGVLLPRCYFRGGLHCEEYYS
ncbi:hypothetical protein QYE76_039706 [Lolium multiflorum]|uniref:Uncharacterized protein n=1 Tax=Lolium multiflorum TaxID=4521 RepID=A0AAD8WUR5_LOLMU|nr:hypothetical protein QYE76_039706 [Lolium multiflorum]